MGFYQAVWYNAQKNSRFYPGKIRGKIGNDAMHLLNRYFVGMMGCESTLRQYNYMNSEFELAYLSRLAKIASV